MTETDVVDKWDYEPPKVSSDPVHEDGVVVAYQPNPPFGMDWDEITGLRWFAALIEHRTGLKVRVAPSGVWTPTLEGEDPVDLYEVLTAHMVGGPAPYQVTWSWLSGFEVGVTEQLGKSNEQDQETI